MVKNKGLALIVLGLLVMQLALIEARPNGKKKAKTRPTEEKRPKGSVATTAKHVECKSCQRAMLGAFGRVHHFVGDDVFEAGKHFCAELEFMELIKDKDKKLCLNKIVEKATKKGKYRYGIPYLGAEDVCEFYGACKLPKRVLGLPA